MDIHLKAKLQDAIDHWMEVNVEEDDWPTVYFGSKTFHLMLDAAVSVFDAVVEFQEYAQAEGLFEEEVC